MITYFLSHPGVVFFVALTIIGVAAAILRDISPGLIEAQEAERLAWQQANHGLKMNQFEDPLSRRKSGKIYTFTFPTKGTWVVDMSKNPPKVTKQ